jgi:signal transduction histidine kinase
MLLVTLATGVLLAALAVGFNVMLRSSLDHDSDNVLSARAAAAATGVEVRRGVIRRAETPDRGIVDALVWVYSRNHATERARAPAPLQAAADSLRGGPRRFVENPGYDVRLLSSPITSGNRRIGTVVVGLSLVPYERTASRALIASVVFAAVVFLLVVLAMRFIVRGALRPVARMTAEAADWSEHDLSHRFQAGEPHDELTRLAATFDSMLDRLAASLDHERRFSAEISHELKTPLAAVAAEAELALRREREPSEYRRALEAIGAKARQLEGILASLLAAARGDLGGLGTADAASVAENCIEVYRRTAAERGVELELRSPPERLRIGVDADAAERALAPLVENACRYARSRVEVRIRLAEDRVEFLVADDGRGVEPGERESIFEPGVRGTAVPASGNGAPGAGLGLALARRLARSYDGDVTFASSEGAFVFGVRRG